MYFGGELSRNMSLGRTSEKGGDSLDKWRRKIGEGTACDTATSAKDVGAHSPRRFLNKQGGGGVSEVERVVWSLFHLSHHVRFQVLQV